MYSLGDYGSMIADCVRTPPYIKAIEAAVKPGSVVVDVGCGTGFFALVACRAGASRVYAIDEAEIIYFAEKLAQANGFAERIKFLRGDSRQIELPERANVMVSDLRGALPFFGPAIASLQDARERFLADGGIMIPQRDTLYAAIVEAEAAYEKITSPWKTGINGLDLSAGLSCTLYQMGQQYANREQLVSEPQAWCVIDYTKHLAANAAAKLLFRATRTAVAHGMLIWFDAQLYEGIGFSCAPGIRETVYSHIFLPWLEPIAVGEGQEIEVALHANLVGVDYVWRWETKIQNDGSGASRHFQQSTLQGAQFSPQWLRKHAEDFVPSLTAEGEAERWLLQAMDGKTALEKIVKDAADRFPTVFRKGEEAFRRVSALAEKFSR